MNIQAKDFSLRVGLENYIRNEVVLSPNKDEPYIIIGNKDELKRLGLSDKRNVYGVKVVCTTAEEAVK